MTTFLMQTRQSSCFLGFLLLSSTQRKASSNFCAINHHPRLYNQPIIIPYKLAKASTIRFYPPPGVCFPPTVLNLTYQLQVPGIQCNTNPPPFFQGDDADELLILSPPPSFVKPKSPNIPCIFLIKKTVLSTSSYILTV